MTGWIMDAALVASAILGVTMLVVLLRRIIRNPKDVLPWVWIALGCFVAWLAYWFGAFSDALHVSRFAWNIQVVLWTLTGFGWATLVVSSLERPWPADRRPSIGRALMVAAATILFLMATPGLVMTCMLLANAMADLWWAFGLVVSLGFFAIPALFGGLLLKVALRRQ